MPRLTVEGGKRLVPHNVLSSPVEDPTDAGLANLLRALEISARANGIVLKGPQVFHTSVVDAGGDPVQSVELLVQCASPPDAAPAGYTYPGKRAPTAREAISPRACPDGAARSGAIPALIINLASICSVILAFPNEPPNISVCLNLYTTSAYGEAKTGRDDPHVRKRVRAGTLLQRG